MNHVYGNVSAIFTPLPASSTPALRVFELNRDVLTTPEQKAQMEGVVRSIHEAFKDVPDEAIENALAGTVPENE